MTAPLAVSVIVVNHRSVAEAGDCVRSLRQAFASEGVAGEIVLVEDKAKLMQKLGRKQLKLHL